MAKQGVKVRGTCPKGHELETTSPPGRVTWQGPCPHEGCGEQLRATRVPKARARTAADVDEPAPTPRPVKKRSYRVVDGYRPDQLPDDPTFEEPTDGAHDQPGGSPRVRPAASAGGGSARPGGDVDQRPRRRAPARQGAGKEAGGEEADDEDEASSAGAQRPGWRDRRRTRRSERLAGLGDETWTVPGIY